MILPLDSSNFKTIWATFIKKNYDKNISISILVKYSWNSLGTGTFASKLLININWLRRIPYEEIHEFRTWKKLFKMNNSKIQIRIQEKNLAALKDSYLWNMRKFDSGNQLLNSIDVNWYLILSKWASERRFQKLLIIPFKRDKNTPKQLTFQVYNTHLSNTIGSPQTWNQTKTRPGILSSSSLW